MIKLKVLNHKNEPEEIFYDQHTSRLSDKDGNRLIDVINHPHRRRGVDISDIYNQKANFDISPETPAKKTNKVRRLKIQLGLGCNYSCSYCLQGSEIAKATASSTLDASIFLKTLDKWLDPTNLTAIEFWGGEPLLYWHKIKILAPELRKRFPHVKFGMVTNGSILTKEIADTLYDWGFSISISHDGPGMHLRGPDPLDDPAVREVWLYVIEKFRNKSSFNVVLTPSNYNVHTIMEWFYKNVSPDINVGFEGVVHDYDNNPTNRFTKESLNELTTSLASALITGSAFRSPMMRDKYKFALDHFINETPSYTLSQKCGMDLEDQLAVDLLGNVMTCQNVGAKGPHRLGHVGLFDKISLNTSWHWSKRKECSSCPVLQLCQGSCMYQEGDNWVSSCHAEFAYNLGYFIAAIHYLTGKLVHEIEGHIIRPVYSFET